MSCIQVNLATKNRIFRDSDRNGGQIPPLVYRSENTDRFYKIPYRIPYNNRLVSHFVTSIHNLRIHGQKRSYQDWNFCYTQIPCIFPIPSRPLDSYDDSDYDNLPRRPPNKSSRTNGALLMPSRGSRGLLSISVFIGHVNILNLRVCSMTFCDRHSMSIP